MSTQLSKIVLLCCVLLNGVAPANAGDSKKFYVGDKVLRIIPASEAHLKLLTDLFVGDVTSDGKGVFLEMWSQPNKVGVPIDLYVRHDKVQYIIGFLDLVRIPYRIVVDDFQGLIDQTDEADRKRLLHKRDIDDDSTPNIVGRYASYSDMTKFMDNVCAKYPAITECGSYGTSFEGRDLRYIRIGTASNSDEKRSIVVEAGLHAREWLAPASIIYVIDKIMTSYEKDEKVKNIVDTYEIYFMPSTNPDGYEYSRSKDRLWRKTRSNATSLVCLGVDGNRNFAIRWGTTGTDANPCSNVYHGPTPFSEPETKAISDLVMGNRQKWLAYFAIHTYSQMWLLPYGFEPGAKPKDYDELLRVANVGGAALMAQSGRTWLIGNTVNLTYPCSGSSDDWAKAIVGMKYSYTLELFPGTNSLTGFVVSEAEIEPSGEEIFTGLLSSIEVMEPPIDDNVADPIAVLSHEATDVLRNLQSTGDEDDEITFSLHELQLILNQLAVDLRSLTIRVDKIDMTCTGDTQSLRSRAERIEALLPKVESRLATLDQHSDILWKAVAATQSRQLSIQRHLLEDSLLLVVTPRFVPHVVSRESLLGETLKLGEEADEETIEALRKLNLDDVTEVVKTRRHRTTTAVNGTSSTNSSTGYSNATDGTSANDNNPNREFVLEMQRMKSHQRQVLLSQKARNCTEQVGFWFEPQYSEVERLAKRSLEVQLSKLKSQYGTSLRYSMKNLKLTTNHGDFYYDTVSKKVVPASVGKAFHEIK